MQKSDLNEAVALTQQVLTALIGTLTVQSGIQGAQLRYVCGALAADAAVELDVDGAPAQFFADLANCFEVARLAGATYVAIDLVRTLAEAAAPAGKPAIAVRNFSVRMALAEQAQILAATTFVSRDDVDNALDQVDAAFETAELVAADNLDNVAYRALIALHAAVANDLSTRARPLPRLVAYSFQDRMPSLWLAQRLYQDASRADELRDENKVIHPLFMPLAGRALSA